MMPELQWPLSDSQRKEPRPLRRLDQGLRDHGFLRLEVPDFDWHRLHLVFTGSRQFFTQSVAEKRLFGYQSASENFGYQGVSEEALNPASGQFDAKEAFTMRNIRQHSGPLESWPSAEFQRLMIAFYEQCFELMASITSSIAVIAGLPEDYFQSRLSGENVTLRLLRYPAATSSSAEADQVLAGEHTDYGLLTLLFQDGAPGLEVQDREGVWQLVPAVANRVVVNVGDLMQRWTNDAYPSTLHRVRQQGNAVDRYSVAFFADPNSNVEVTPWPTFVTAEKPARYQTILSGEHIQAKLEASHRPLLSAGLE